MNDSRESSAVCDRETAVTHFKSITREAYRTRALFSVQSSFQMKCITLDNFNLSEFFHNETCKDARTTYKGRERAVHRMAIRLLPRMSSNGRSI